MTIEVKPSLGPMTWMKGRSVRPAKTPLGNVRVRLALLPAIAIVGFAAWTMLPRPSDAEGGLVAARSAVLRSEQNMSWFDPVITQVQATVTSPAETAPAQTPPAATPPAQAVPPAQAMPPAQQDSFNSATAAEVTAPEATTPLDGLKISSQSWRRGGLGSKALITFTLRNGNDYAVKDIEIACAFSRRDGSHLTDRTRTIHDVVNMKSRKKFARLHVGFVNVNADKAKCSLVAASHI